MNPQQSSGPAQANSLWTTCTKICLLESPVAVMTLGFMCGGMYVQYIRETIENPTPSTMDPTLGALSKAVSISYMSASFLLSWGLAWGTCLLERAFLENVVLGLKIRIATAVILLPFQFYVISEHGDLILIPVLGWPHFSNKTTWKGNVSRSLDPKAIVLQSVNFLQLALENPADKGKDEDPDKKNDELYEKTNKSIQKLALKNPADKDKDKNPNKKSDRRDAKHTRSIEKFLELMLGGVLLLFLFSVEIFVVYRLGIFVDNLPQATTA
ncbi:uncharacterized protein [Dermacentor albipictus]|uniref:uncharacterized protein n=1 Tax=Dermacentor albipictus TaxID=60249 RepID=UPI0031FC401E